MTALSEPAPKILICEVGPRDGLQSESRIWSVAERVELIDRLSASGLRRMEAVSFVNPKRVPQMAGAEEVMAAIKRPGGVQFAGLALNLREIAIPSARSASENNSLDIPPNSSGAYCRPSL